MFVKTPCSSILLLDFSETISTSEFLHFKKCPQHFRYYIFNTLACCLSLQKHLDSHLEHLKHDQIKPFLYILISYFYECQSK